MRIISLIDDETVCRGSWYDVAEELHDSMLYVWDASGEYYLLYSDEYEITEYLQENHFYES